MRGAWRVQPAWAAPPVLMSTALVGCAWMEEMRAVSWGSRSWTAMAAPAAAAHVRMQPGLRVALCQAKGARLIANDDKVG